MKDMYMPWIIESRVVVNSTWNALRTNVLFTDELKCILKKGGSLKKIKILTEVYGNMVSFASFFPLLFFRKNSFSNLNKKEI